MGEDLDAVGPVDELLRRHTSPSPAKIGSSAMPWTWAGSPADHFPRNRGGTNDSSSTAPRAPGRFWQRRCAAITPERPPEVHQLRRNRVGRGVRTLVERVAEALGVGDPGIDGVEGAAVVQIGRMDGVPGCGDPAGERGH